MQLLFWIAVGLLAGWLTGKITSSKGRDLLMDIAMGIAGGMAGGLIVEGARLTVQGKMVFTNLAAIAGAVIMAFLSRVIRRRRRQLGRHSRFKSHTFSDRFGDGLLFAPRRSSKNCLIKSDSMPRVEIH